MPMARVIPRWRVRCMAVLAAHHTDSGSRCSTKQPIDAENLVNGRPMNAKTTTCYLPVMAILLGRMQKPWMPSKWNRNSSAVLKLDNKKVVCKTHIDDSRSRIYYETPAIPSQASPYWHSHAA
jgi:hypothetical protein